MKPVAHYIVVEDVENEITNSTGLVLSGQDAENVRYRECVINAIGNLVTPELELEQGQTIYRDKNAGFSIFDNGIFITVIHERDVIGIKD